MIEPEHREEHDDNRFGIVERGHAPDDGLDGAPLAAFRPGGREECRNPSIF